MFIIFIILTVFYIKVNKKKFEIVARISTLWVGNCNSFQLGLPQIMWFCTWLRRSMAIKSTIGCFC